MSEKTEDSVDRRIVLRRASSVAAGIGILGTMSSGQVVGANSSDDDGDGSGVGTDSGPTQPDPGIGGGITYSDAEWGNFTSKMDSENIVIAPNPGSLPHTTYITLSSTERANVTTSTEFVLDQRCGQQLHVLQVTIKREIYQENFGSGGQWVIAAEHNTWMGINPNTGCVYAGGSGISCKKVNCPSLPEGTFTLAEDPLYDSIEQAAEEIVDFFQSEAGLAVGAMGVAAGIVYGGNAAAAWFAAGDNSVSRAPQ